MRCSRCRNSSLSNDFGLSISKPKQFNLKDKINKLAIGQAEIKGDVKALDVKTEQLNTRVGNVEFAVRGILIGLAVVVLGGFAMFFWMSRRLQLN